MWADITSFSRVIKTFRNQINIFEGWNYDASLFFSKFAGKKKQLHTREKARLAFQKKQREREEKSQVRMCKFFIVCFHLTCSILRKPKSVS